MMWPFKRTPKQSETSLLLATVSSLAAEMVAQSESSRRISTELLARLTERDAQIRMVLESKFQQYVTMAPARTEKPQEPESTEYLADVSEMSEASAEAMVEKNTRDSKAADETLKDALAEEFEALAVEHAEAHRETVQA